MTWGCSHEKKEKPTQPDSEEAAGLAFDGGVNR